MLGESQKHQSCVDAAHSSHDYRSGKNIALVMSQNTKNNRLQVAYILTISFVRN